MNFSKLKLPCVTIIVLALGVSYCPAAPNVPPPIVATFSMPTNAPSPAAPSTNPPPIVGTFTMPTNPPVLKWDADLKDYHAKLGEPTANVTFYLTNTSLTPAVVKSVKTSCGCTAAHLPPMPWTIAPGQDGKIDVSMNLAGKTGIVIKTVTVDSTAGVKVLQVRVTMPDPQVERQQNMQLALADRQAVFKDNCATCHSAPAEGKTGEALFHAVCGVCHEAKQRATMVPDLHNLKIPTDREFWKTWITSGKPVSLMPAWSKAQGGPLTAEQIESLVGYLATAIPSVDTNAPSPH